MGSEYIMNGRDAAATLHVVWMRLTDLRTYFAFACDYDVPLGPRIENFQTLFL